jgi:hypothetical protein
MNEPKLHHYVPRFYLNNFVGANGKLCVYDKDLDKEFEVSPNKIAAKTHFYRIPEPIPESIDPLVIEKNLSKLESKASTTMKKIVDEISNLDVRQKLSITADERLIFSEFLATQYFRTLEFRELMMYLLKEEGMLEGNMSNDEMKALQFAILSESGILEELEESIYKSIWIFAKNESDNPLITSDHPVCIQSKNNRMWRKGLGSLDEGSYVVFPVTPDIALYCKEPSYWYRLKALDLCISPVKLDSEMVDHENSGQAFMSSRFLFSCQPDFTEVEGFISTIGTRQYAVEENDNDVAAVERTAKYLTQRKGQK